MTYRVYNFFLLVVARTSQGLYPQLPAAPLAVQPSAPPADEGYGGSSSSDSSERGIIRPHSVSPFLRHVRQRLESEEEEEIDMEAVACLLNFSTRGGEGGGQTPSQTVTTTTVSSFRIGGPSGSAESDVMVRTFRTSTPTTPAAASRPDHPPRIASRRILPLDTPRPNAIRPPSAALGAPPSDEGDEDLSLPDIPDTPASPSTSDITVIRLVNCFKKIFLL